MQFYKNKIFYTHLYKQFGNSVTVPVIRAIAEQIKLYLEKVKLEMKPREELYKQIAIAWR